ncbi:uncharacterized protein LOC133332899 [Musca vetustissima]|uniref:uncharacterized protein LOC133332899 n=1 Tax=Musca vetustissima TaxID=27455 RepID=UPI002AB734F5|nr:uncharacterized protein LOC133332899 [Musca vetustissima]
MGCFSCVSKQSDAADGEQQQYGQPMQCTLELSPLRIDSQEDLRTPNNNVTAPLTQTKVKTRKSGNTITVTKTTRVVNQVQTGAQLRRTFEISRPKTPDIPLLQPANTTESTSSSSPIVKTKVKKSGNTVTVVKTIYSTNVINTTPKIEVVEVGGGGGGETSNNERVYRSTVTPIPVNTPKRKRFNLKSILDRRPKQRNTNEGEGNEEDLYNFEQRCLVEHNRLRALHGVKPLTLNKQMCDYAMEWAKHLAKKNKLKHRKKCKFGENLAFGTGSSYSVEDATQSWYDEMEYYDFKNPGFSGNTGHFSQLVWQESTQLGVGVVKNRNDRTWVVCNYDPPGNILGKFEDNVLRPKGRQPKPQPSRLITISKTEPDSKPGRPTNVVPSKTENDNKPSTSQALKKVIGNKHGKWSAFELECLEEHNKRRALHGCEPLVLNRKLCSLANDWAIHLTKTRSMYHRPNNDYGENIYQLINRDPTAEDAVKAWYDEINKYKFNKPGFSSATGHFTQVVWLDTKEVGVGKAKVDNMTFIVCNYDPPGNVMGQYKTQVPPLGGFKTIKKDCSPHDNANSSLLTSETNQHSITNKKPVSFEQEKQRQIQGGALNPTLNWPLTN